MAALCRLNGKQLGDKVPDLAFYNALLKIWIGAHPGCPAPPAWVDPTTGPVLPGQCVTAAIFCTNADVDAWLATHPGCPRPSLSTNCVTPPPAGAPDYTPWWILAAVVGVGTAAYFATRGPAAKPTATRGTR